MGDTQGNAKAGVDLLQLKADLQALQTRTDKQMQEIGERMQKTEETVARGFVTLDKQHEELKADMKDDKGEVHAALQLILQKLGSAEAAEDKRRKVGPGGSPRDNA